LVAIAQVFTKNFRQLAIDPNFFHLDRRYHHRIMEPSKCRSTDQNPELSTTTANVTTTEELETANILAEQSSGM
jgi:hypothetical protein